MRKSNIITLTSFIIMIISTALYINFSKAPVENIDQNQTAPAQSEATSAETSLSDIPQSTQPQTDTTLPETKPSQTKPPITSTQPATPPEKTTAAKPTESPAHTTEQKPTAPLTEAKPAETKPAEAKPSETKPTEAKPTKPANPPVSSQGSLFIGDSRTVGLSEYAQIAKADFFANIGMSVYNIHKKAISVPSVGKVTLTELLDKRKYDKIYIMLGINEAGYNFDKTASKYNELIKFIKEKQPDAVIFIQANLHVTKKRSDKDKIINNKAINTLNGKLAKLADGKKIFYLDANVLFDDENGNLSADKSEDDAHLYAKYYTQWGKWIVTQTASLLEEG